MRKYGIHINIASFHSTFGAYVSCKFSEDMIFKVTLPKSFQGIKFQLGC